MQKQNSVIKNYILSPDKFILKNSKRHDFSQSLYKKNIKSFQIENFNLK